ncbi:Uncharacterised protein [Dorea longicatena]|nr:Uncharacterised protein [Dorea longicatena]
MQFLLPCDWRIYKILQRFVQFIHSGSTAFPIRSQDLYLIHAVFCNLVQINPPDNLCRFICSFTGNELKILPKAQISLILLHQFCIIRYAAQSALPVNQIQYRDRNQPAGNQLPEHIPGSYGWKLVLIPD